MSIGRRLSFLMEETGITAADLAEAAKIPEETLKTYLNDGEEPDLTDLAKIAACFKNYNLSRRDLTD